MDAGEHFPEAETCIKLETSDDGICTNIESQASKCAEVALNTG